MRRHRWHIGALVLLAALLASPLWRQGIAGSDDILDSIYRVFALDSSWRSGILYPRLAPDLAYGYSAPLFQYYPPLTSYLAQLVHLAGLGFVGSIKLTAAAGLFLSGLGMYVYVLRLYDSRAGALLAAVAYMSAPYQLADIYVRGATAEGIALAFLPWILWSLHALHRSGGGAGRPRLTQPADCHNPPATDDCSGGGGRSRTTQPADCHSPATDQCRGWFVLTALLMAGLSLTHNSLALFFLLIAGSYALILGVGRGLVRCAGALVAGLGVSCFFWLPAILERGSVKILTMAQGFYDPVNNLTPWAQLVQPGLLFDYTRPAVFALPLVLTAVALGGAGAALLCRVMKPIRRIAWFFTLLSATCIFLQLPLAAPFWQHVPLVGFIQFPWRLFAFVSLGSAVLAGAIPPALARARLSTRTTLTGAAIALLLIAACGRLWSDYDTAYEAGRFTEDQIGREDMYARGRVGFELFSDYSPVWVKESMTELAAGDSAVDAIEPLPSPAPEVAILRIMGFTTELWVSTGADFPLTIHRFYFPGWEASIDGVLAPVYASGSLGLVTVDVPAGSHTVVLAFGPTTLREIATGVSGLALLSCAIALAPVFRRRRWVGIVALVVTLSVYGGWRWLHRPLRPLIQESATANLGGVAQLVGFALDRTVVRAGESIRITLGWFALDSIETDYKVFIHLRDAGDAQTYAQHDGTPVFGYTPTTRWLPGELITDPHELVLPIDLPPGKYLLIAGLYDPDSLRNLPVEEAREVMAGERLFVEEIVVRPG